MTELTPTAAEQAADRFDTAAVERAITALREDGFVVIADVVDHTHLDLLRDRMTDDLEKIRAQRGVPHNFVWGNIQQNPPPDAGLVFRDVVANPFVCQVTRAVLGTGAFNDYLSGNTNVPGSGLQPVHVDDGQLWPDLREAHPPARLVVNVAATVHGATVLKMPPRSRAPLALMPAAIDPALNPRDATTPPDTTANPSSVSGMALIYG